MKTIKTFLILIVLLIAGSISVYAGGAEEASDYLPGGAAGAPGAPTGVTAARNPAGSTNIRVSWNAVSGATSYRVYWSNTNSGDGYLEGEPTTTSFTSEDNQTNETHYFRVTAVNSAGEGTASSWISVGPVTASGSTSARLPGAPTGVTAARNPAGSTNIRVSWNAVSGATSYKVYWSNTNSGSGYLEGEPTTTSFISEDNQTNETHYFRVTAVNSAGEGAPSSWVSVGPATASGTPAQSGGPTNWRVVSNSRFGDSYINAIAYGNNRFVAVGGEGKMAYSADGATWTAVSNSRFGTSNIIDIAYGGNRFVAVGREGKMAYSTDGATWTAVSNSRFGDTLICAIAYGNNRFVAVGGEGKMAYSADGASWTAVSSSTFGGSYINGIAYGNNRFVAVGEDAKIAYSTDGARWTAVSAANRRVWEYYWDDGGRNVPIDIVNIAYGGNRFVAGGYPGKIAYSADGVTWTMANSPFESMQVTAIGWGNNMFLAANGEWGYFGGMAYSTDGATWTRITTNPLGGDDIQAIAYGNGRFIAGGFQGGMAYCDW